MWSIATLALVLSSIAADKPALTLEAARARALERSPGLSAARAATRAAEGAWEQARALPNPELTIDYDGFGGTIPEPTEAQTLFALEQPLELGGKRRARGAERDLARSVSRHEADIARLELLAEVRRRFVRVLGLQARTALLEESVRTAEAIQKTVHDLVAAGEVSPIEELKVEADASLARIDLRSLESALAVARQELAETWGERVPDFGVATGVLDEPVDLPGVGGPDAAAASLPDLARGEADVRRLEAALESEKKKRVPDLAVTAGVQEYREFGERSFVAGLRIPLPVFDRNAGAVAEATARLEQGRLERAASEARVATPLASARERLAWTASEVVALRETVLPRTRQVLDGIEEGYRRGKFRLLDLLDARRALAAVQLRYNDALVEFNVAEADVERFTPSEPIGGSR